MSPILFQTNLRITNHRGQKFPPSITLLSFKTRIEWPSVLTATASFPRQFRAYSFNELRSFRPMVISPPVTSPHTEVTSLHVRNCEICRKLFVLMLELDWFWTQHLCYFRLFTTSASSRVRLNTLATLNIISFDDFPQHEFLSVVISGSKYTNSTSFDDFLIRCNTSKPR